MVPQGMVSPIVAPRAQPDVARPVATSLVKQPAPAAPVAPRLVVNPQPRLSTRAALEALRLGVVPTEGIQHFTVGLEKERELVKQALASPRGSVHFFTAPYGSGKSHTLELASQLALSTGFAVAAAEMDRQEVTFRHPKRMYRSLAQSLRLPSCPDEGMEALVSRLAPRGGFHAFSEWAQRVVDQRLHFLGPALVNYWRAGPEDSAREEILAYMSGDQVPVGRLNAASVLKEPRLGRFLPIPGWSTERGAIAMAQLLSDLATLVTMCGSRGLLILLDEGEHYRDLTFQMRFRADVLMQRLLDGVEDGSIPRTHLMMAVTPVPDEDYPDWISERPLSEIADPSRVDVERFVRSFGDLYVDAYPQSAPPGEEAVAALVESLWDSSADIGNMRMFTKALVSAWDIVRMTPTSWSELLADWR